MKKIITIFISLNIVVALFGAPKLYNIFGNVENSFTREPISNVSVTLMRPDSSEITTVQTRKATVNGRPSCFFSFELSREVQGKFIVRFTHLNYETLYTNIDIQLGKRISEYTMDIILLKHRKERALKEVIVSATKVKMVVQGDTVVYNADAFKLADGSMLDALIKQLPGAELKNDGRIYVNGRFVNSLLLNGKDFFKGNNRVLLDNLPSYMVNTVKVFEQSVDMGRFDGKDMMPKLFVMEVNLKKEYSIGWIANAEAGYGSGNKFLGRVFGMRFTPNSRLTLFGNTNNINDTRRPGEDGEWKPSDVVGGQQTSSIGGFDYRADDKNRVYTYSNSTQVEQINTDIRFHSTEETFLPSGNVFSRSQKLSENKDLKVATQNTLRLTWKRIFWNSDLSFDYSKKTNDVYSRSGVLSSSPPDGYSVSQSLDSIFLLSSGWWSNNAINRTINQLKSQSRYSNTHFGSTFSVKPWRELPDLISLKLDASYNFADNNTYDHNGVDYLSQLPIKSDFRSRYTNKPERKYDFSSKLIYYYCLANGLRISPAYKYKQTYRADNKTLYRLDRLNGWGVGTSRPIDALPSTYDSLQMALDIQNSYYSTQRQYIHEGSLELYGILKMPRGKNYTGGSLQLESSFPIHIERNTFEYRRNALDTMLVRPITSFAPNISLVTRQWGEGKTQSITLNFSSIVTVPTMSYLMNIRDDANPLNVFVGNSSLKNTTTHSLGLGYSKFNKEYRKTFNVNYNLNIVQNAVALGFLYDKISGVRTTTPQNVDGNWYTNMKVGYNQTIDKQEVWSFNTSTFIGYNRNVDLIGLTNGSQIQQSVVDNLNVREDFALRYQNKWLLASGKFGINAAHLTSERKDFQTIDYRDYNYGVNTLISLPWKIQFSSDLIQYSRRGYDDQSMNTDDLVWNLRLSKSVLQGNITLMFDAFDVLGNLSNVNRSINAQGRSEYYYNVMPRYVLFHAIYRLNIKPKKQSN